MLKWNFIALSCSWSGSQYGSRYSLDHPGTRPLSEAGRPLGPEHPGTRLASPALTYTSLQNTKSQYSNSRPGQQLRCCILLDASSAAGSRNGKYNGNGVSNGGYSSSSFPGPGPVYTGLGTGPRPAPAVYQAPHTPSRSRTPVRTPRSRARARHRAREAGAQYRPLTRKSHN